MIEPPVGTGIHSCGGGSLRDPRLPRSLPRFGPFPDTQTFHYWLREATEVTSLQSITANDIRQDIERMIMKQDGAWPMPVFTHADLNPFNILVRGDQVVGIVDWECAGWYPCYWEYTSAWYGNRTRTEWRDRLIRVLDPFPEEIDMEAVRQRWWGEI